MLRERIVSFDFSRISDLYRREILRAYAMLTKFDPNGVKYACTGLDNLQEYYVKCIT